MKEVWCVYSDDEVLAYFPDRGLAWCFAEECEFDVCVSVVRKSIFVEE